MRAPLLFSAAIIVLSTALLCNASQIGPYLHRRDDPPQASTTPHVMRYYYICPPWNSPTTGKTVYATMDRGALEYDTNIFACLFWTHYDDQATYELDGYDSSFFCLYYNTDGSLVTTDPNVYEGSDDRCFSSPVPQIALKLDECLTACPLEDTLGNTLYLTYWFVHGFSSPNPTVYCLYGYDPETYDYQTGCSYDRATKAFVKSTVGERDENCEAVASDTCTVGGFYTRFKREDNLSALFKKRQMRAINPSPAPIPQNMRTRAQLAKNKRR